MAKFSDIYAHDKVAAEEGTWAPIGGGVTVKVRSLESAHAKALRKKLNEPFASLIRVGKEIPEDDQNEIFIKLIAHSALLDWNLEDVTFSPEKAEELLRAEPDFLRDIIAVLTSRETFKRREREIDAGN